MNQAHEANTYLQVARQLSLEAAQIVRGFYQSSFKKHQKADRTPVTEADLASDRHIIAGLQKRFPHHAILTEETGHLTNNASTFTWVIDPLDGTKAFAKGIPGFSVMIGLLRDDKPYLGVVADPHEEHLYEAIAGQGAFHTFQGKRTQVHVSSRSEFSKMPVVISTGFPDTKLHAAQAALNFPLIAPINSVGIKVGLLVRQVGDIYLNHHGVSYWDTCAPQIILEEAGGVMTLMNGSNLSYDFNQNFQHSSPTLATNGTRHEEILAWCKRLEIP